MSKKVRIAVGSAILLMALANGAQAESQAESNEATCRNAFPSVSVFPGQFDAFFFRADKSGSDKTVISPPKGGGIDALICRKTANDDIASYSFVPGAGGPVVRVTFDTGGVPACHMVADVTNLILDNSGPHSWAACVWLKSHD